MYEPKDWIQMISVVATAGAFIFLILEYRNARIQRREDKDARKEEEKRYNCVGEMIISNL
jgi:hypothetical protein